MTIVEAYSAGMPVIGADMGNVGDLIENEKIGVTCNNSYVESIAEAVIQLNDYTKRTVCQYKQMYTETINHKLMVHIYLEVKK